MMTDYWERARARHYFTLGFVFSEDQAVTMSVTRLFLGRINDIDSSSRVVYD